MIDFGAAVVLVKRGATADLRAGVAGGQSPPDASALPAPKVQVAARAGSAVVRGSVVVSGGWCHGD